VSINIVQSGVCWICCANLNTESNAVLLILFDQHHLEMQTIFLPHFFLFHTFYYFTNYFPCIGNILKNAE